MSATATVTIGIPTRNRPELLRRSLRSAVAQTYPALEILVADASLELNGDVLQELRDPRVVVLPGATTDLVTDNWNICVAAAKGEYFLGLPDDDYLEPGAIEQLVGAIDTAQRQHGVRREQIGLAYGRVATVDANARRLSLGRMAPTIETGTACVCGYFRGRRDTSPCGMLLRTEDLHTAGGYPGVTLPFLADDHPWITAVLRRGYAVFARSRVATSSLHASNYGLGQDAATCEREVQWLVNVARSTQVDKKAASALEEAGRYWIAASISYRILARARATGRRGQAVRELWQFRKHFRGVRGAVVLGRNALRLLVPSRVEDGAKRVKASLSGSGEAHGGAARS